MMKMMSNKLNATQEELLEILNKAKEKLYKMSTKVEPLIYYMSGSGFKYLKKNNLIERFCKEQLYNFGFTRLCVVQRKELYEINSDGSIKLLEKLE